MGVMMPPTANSSGRSVPFRTCMCVWRGWQAKRIPRAAGRGFSSRCRRSALALGLTHRHVLFGLAGELKDETLSVPSAQ